MTTGKLISGSSASLFFFLLKSLTTLSLKLCHLLVCVSLPVLSLDGQLLCFLLGQQAASRRQPLLQLLHSGRLPLNMKKHRFAGER